MLLHDGRLATVKTLLPVVKLSQVIVDASERGRDIPRSTSRCYQRRAEYTCNPPDPFWYAAPCRCFFHNHLATRSHLLGLSAAELDAYFFSNASVTAGMSLETGNAGLTTSEVVGGPTVPTPGAVATTAGALWKTQFTLQVRLLGFGFGTVQETLSVTLFVEPPMVGPTMFDAAPYLPLR